jgi:hypothetical protein
VPLLQFQDEVVSLLLERLSVLGEFPRGLLGPEELPRTTGQGERLAVAISVLIDRLANLMPGADARILDNMPLPCCRGQHSLGT